jgi:molybdopterin molybdotransferase
MSLEQARDQVLAEPVTSRVDLPTFDTAAMDGWAVRGRSPWHLIGEARAGDDVQALSDGDAIRISTGAVVPPGCGVLRSEDGVESDGFVKPHTDVSEPAAGADTRLAGEEVRAKEIVLSEGDVLTPPALGLAAAAGVDQLSVIPRPTVAAFVLGDELVDHGVPTAGQVRDALSPQLAGWVETMHGSIVSMRRIKDTLGDTLAAVQASHCDVVVTTGGTARGPVDHVRTAVEELGGHWIVDGVAVRPGHPMKLAVLSDGRPWVALPGNPLAAVSALVTLGQPLLTALSGRSSDAHHTGAGVQRPLSEVLESSPGAHRLIPAQVRDGQVHPVLRRGPAMLSGLATADVLAVVPPGPAPLSVGTPVMVLPLPWGSGLVV